MWRNTETTYGFVAQLLHWLIAGLFILQIGLGFLTQATGSDPVLQFTLYQWHKSLGFTIFGLALIRVFWFAASIHPLPYKDTNRLEVLLAGGAHRMLLAMTILIPLTGWAVVSSSPLDIPSYVFDLFVMPNLPLTVSDADEAFWSWLHAALVYGMIAIVTLHVIAALHHHLIRQDGTLRRMVSFPLRSFKNSASSQSHRNKSS
ncbi:cytochrome b [Ochrobactrum pecoris]|uniref:Cytochrome b n=1 Tax=Brucella pecoris TaxID=867683 RepID=A0A5C5CXB1_9HYPH|nr:cytochrome b [Brucella pecoris]MBB4091884.1 cytochrome b561 [Brucella pecoris]NKW82295.1 cytochrome b [Brucella pecoris]TNV15654.1 cytochrome b [Brucella pecoris]